MSLMVSGLFESIKSKQTTHDITVRLAYMEIYNEAIKDLLSLNTKGLQIREHTKSDTTIIHVNNIISDNLLIFILIDLL